MRLPDSKGFMEYTSYKSIKYYDECAALVEGMGYKLVELKIVPSKTTTKISAMIASTEPEGNIGVELSTISRMQQSLLYLRDVQFVSGIRQSQTG